MSAFVHPHFSPSRAPVLQANLALKTVLKHLILCSSRKYPYPMQGKSLENLRESLKENMYFPGGRGVGGANHKTIHWRGMDIFWNDTLIINLDVFCFRAHYESKQCCCSTSVRGITVKILH